jgi:hypothetical protein
MGEQAGHRVARKGSGPSMVDSPASFFGAEYVLTQPGTRRVHVIKQCIGIRLARGID